MIDLRDVPILGRLLVVVGSFADMIFQSGEFLYLLVDFLLANIDLLATSLKTLESINERIPILPPGVIDDAVTLVLVALLAFELFRIFGGINKRLDK